MGVVAVLQARLLRRGVGGDHPRAPLWPWRGSVQRHGHWVGMELAWLGSHPQPQGCPLITLHVDKTLTRHCASRHGKRPH